MIAALPLLLLLLPLTNSGPTVQHRNTCATKPTEQTPNSLRYSAVSPPASKLRGRTEVDTKSGLRKE